MADLLIHSMAEFGDLVLAALDVAGARDLVEIGSEFGGMSRLLADHAAAAGGTLTSIDPAPKPAFLDWVAAEPGVRHVALPSLDAISTLATPDAWVIDGDHNWYTVYHELCGAADLAERDGKPLLAFLHDVGWPCARRDTYYVPDRIPAAYRHAHDFDGGMLLGEVALAPGRGFRGMGQFAAAAHEGGARNGVLTAVEDFRADMAAAGVDTCLAIVPAVFGLGVLFDASAPWAEALGRLLLPWHENRLIATLEENRLRNYLAVLDWQDRHAA